jgi:hypothetical protein
MKRNGILLAICFCLLAIPVFAQKNLEKPFDQWGREESLKLVNDSPWSKPYQSTAGSTVAAAGQVAREQTQTVNSGGSNPRSVSRDFGPPPVTMRLHSALVVRQALVRLEQFEVGYDKMNATDKAAFDAARKSFLDCSICKDYYVITLIKSPDPSGSSTEEAIFQGMTFNDMKGNIKLVNDKGEERELVQFNAPKNSRDRAVFYFKRLDASGNPFLTPDSKYFKFSFESTFLSTSNRFAYLVPHNFEFKVSKIVVGDKVMF